MMAKIEWYEEILALEPGSKVFFPFAKRLENEGLRDKAVAVLRQGLLQHPEYMEARVLLAHLLQDSGTQAEAAAEAQAVFLRLSAYPGFWDAASTSAIHQPGDTALLLSLLAEGLRCPGLTLTDVLRRALAGTEAVPVVEPEATVSEPELTIDASQELVAEEFVVEESLAEAAFSAPDPLETVPFDEASSVLECEVESAEECSKEESSKEESSKEEYAKEALHEEAFAEENIFGGDTPDTPHTLDDDDEECFESIEEAVYVDEPDLPLLVQEDATGEIVAEDESADEAAPEAAEATEAAALEDMDIENMDVKDTDIDDALEIDAPEIDAAEIESPEIDALEIDAPEIEIPESQTPEPTPAHAGQEEDDLLESDDGIDDTLLDAALLDAAQLLESTLADLDDVTQPDDIALDAGLLDDGLLDESPVAVEPEIEDESETEKVAPTPEPAEEPAEPEEQEPTPEPERSDDPELIDALGIPDASEASAEPEQIAEPEPADDDEPVCTRSMAEVLAEQGDTEGALGIYAELAAGAETDERDSLVARMEELNAVKNAEKSAPEHKSGTAKAEKDRGQDRSGLRSMLENLAGRLEKRAKTKN